MCLNKKRLRRFGLIYIVLALPQSGCSSWGTFWQVGSFTAFRFEAGTNNIHKTYTGEISGTQVTVELPYGVLTKAIASFEVADASVVSAGGRAQTSGVTANDFSSPVTYRLGSSLENGREITVTVLALSLVPDTGQTSCYTGTGAGDTATACTGNTGTNPGQDADYATPAPRAFVAPQQHAQFTADYTTRDQLSGLTYRTCAEGQTGAGCAGSSSQPWANAAPLCSALNAANGGAGYAGLTDWRVPSVAELANLLNFQSSAPTGDAAYFPNTLNGGYWSADEYKVSNAYGWAVSFNNAVVNSTQQKTLANAVRCVAGGYAPSSAFKDNGDGTISDSRTKLRWQKCAIGLSGAACGTGTFSTVTWSAALNACNNLNLAGKLWRLPNVNELRSIVDYSRAAAPAFDATVFPGNATASYWTSSTPSFNMTNAWAVDFGGANIGSVQYYVKTNTYAARCVTDN